MERWEEESGDAALFPPDRGQQGLSHVRVLRAQVREDHPIMRGGNG